MARFKRSMASFVGIMVLGLAATAGAGTVRGKGRVMYYSNGANGGSYLPLAGARVHLIDDDGLVGDDTLKSGYTNSNGYFDLTGSDDDGWFGGKLDPYIQVELLASGGKVVVESEVFKVNVTCSTGVRNSTEGTIDFGTFHCSTRDPSTLFAHTRTQYNKFTALTGQSYIPRHGGKAAVLYPATLAAGVPWTTEESIHWPSGYRSFKAVYHEFGHRIRHAQDGDAAHFLYDVAKYSYPQQHYYSKYTNSGFAFNEGWAEYHSTILDSSAASTFNGWNTASYSGGSNNVEGNVAAKLYRAAKYCGGFKRMWLTLKQGNIHSYSSFRSKLRATFDGSSTLRAAYPSCLSNVVAAAEAPATEKLALLVSSRDTPIGALSPTKIKSAGEKVTASAQAAVLAKIGANAKARAARLKGHARLVRISSKLKGLGDRLVNVRLDFEKRAADRLDKYLRGLKPHQATKEALAQHRAARETFLRTILKDRIDALERQRAQLSAEKKKGHKGTAAKALDRLTRKIDRFLKELRQAAKTGVVKRHLLPRSFGGSTETR